MDSPTLAAPPGIVPDRGARLPDQPEDPWLHVAAGNPYHHLACQTGICHRRAMSANVSQMTPRAFLEKLEPTQLVRVGADKPGGGVKEWPAAELLHDWQEEEPPNPYLD